jgi:hypothetical protein
LAFDGLKLPSHAATEGSGTVDDLTPQQATLAATVRPLLEPPETADTVGEGARPGARRSAQEQVHAPSPR